MAGYELAVERVLDAPAAAVWRAFSEHLALWWCPRPWTTEVVTMELRAGGRFVTIMRNPEGEGGPMAGIFLEVVPERRVVFTNVVDGDWQPQNSEVANIVGIFEFEADGERTRYRASARHWDEAAMRKHDEIGFSQGWGAVAGQLEEVAQRIAGGADA
jgi:uncharacterized protein YndB with AHSA1/START domain